MKITESLYEREILKELGNRIKQHRISINITQIELAERCGISPSTEIRIENGVDSKISNYIKIFYVCQEKKLLLDTLSASLVYLYKKAFLLFGILTKTIGLM